MSDDRPMLRFLLVNWSLGMILGCLFAGAVLFSDLAGIRSMLMRSDNAFIPLVLLFVGFAATCGGVVCASAVMRLPDEDDSNGPGLAEAADPIPVLATVRQRQRAQ